MQKLKNNKGITLIALIITIIVMLILVAVTINVALNGGLFGKAKDAKVKTQKEVEREQLLEAVLGAYNNQGSFIIGNVKLPEEMEWADDNKTTYGSNSTATPSNDGNWVATKNGNYFYIDSYGNILEEEPKGITSKIAGTYKSIQQEKSGDDYSKTNLFAFSIIINSDGTGKYVVPEEGTMDIDVELKEDDTVILTMESEGEKNSSELRFIQVTDENENTNKILIGKNEKMAPGETNPGIGVKGVLEGKSYTIEGVTYNFDSDGIVTQHSSNGEFNWMSYYVCYNGRVYFWDHILEISQDGTTLTKVP